MQVPVFLHRYRRRFREQSTRISWLQTCPFSVQRAMQRSRSERPRIRRKLQKAYDCDTYREAKTALESLKPELRLMNQSAVTSLEEGLEETLTLHRLGMLPFLKRSFRTTNCIEALNSMTGDLTRKVKRWNNSPQRHRWVAAALLDIEPRLRRVKGYKHLPLLRRALKTDLKLDADHNSQQVA